MSFTPLTEEEFPPRGEALNLFWVLNKQVLIIISVCSAGWFHRDHMQTSVSKEDHWEVGGLRQVSHLFVCLSPIDTSSVVLTEESEVSW